MSIHYQPGLVPLGRFVCILLIVSNFLSRGCGFRTRNFCDCSLEAMQNKFCKQDFVIIGKRTNWRSSPNRVLLSPNGGDASLYIARVHKIKIIYSFKGLFMDYGKENFKLSVYFLHGSCGRSMEQEMRRHYMYLISGYVDKGRLVVTSCSIFQEVDDLTPVQVMGLFRHLYDRYCWSMGQCMINVLLTRPTNSCDIRPTALGCFNKYAICQPTIAPSNGHCEIMRNLTMTWNDVRRMPRLFRRKMRAIQLKSHPDLCYLKLVN